MTPLASSLLALSLSSLVAFGCAAPTGTEEESGSSTSDLSSCRDVSGTYRVGGTCSIGGGKAVDGTPVTVIQASGCTTITLRAKVETPPPPAPHTGPSNPYDMCALACFDQGSHAGHGYLPPGCVCGIPAPPAPPPAYTIKTVTEPRSSVQDWSGARIDVDGCALIRTGGAVTPPPAPTSPPTPVPVAGPTGHLVRASFLLTPTLGYDEYLAAGTVVALTPLPANVQSRPGNTWVSVHAKNGFVSNYDLAK